MPWASFPHIPKVRHGYECPQPSVALPVAGGSATFNLRFVFDTGAAVTLVPVPLADRYGIVYPEELAAAGDCPNTMRGRLTGHAGEIRATFLQRALVIPCFFYVPTPNPTPAPGPGPGVHGPAQRRRVRTIADPDAWLEASMSGADSEDHLLVLGRLGFLNRFHVLIRDGETVVSTDPIPLPGAGRRRT